MSPHGPDQLEFFRVVNHDGHRRVVPATHTRQTRGEAFREADRRELDAKLRGALPRNQQRVYDALRAAPEGLSDREIAQAAGLRINVVPAARGRLVETGRVVPGPVRACSLGGRNVQTWRAA